MKFSNPFKTPAEKTDHNQAHGADRPHDLSATSNTMSDERVAGPPQPTERTGDAGLRDTDNYTSNHNEHEDARALSEERIGVDGLRRTTDAASSEGGIARTMEDRPTVVEPQSGAQEARRLENVRFSERDNTQPETKPSLGEFAANTEGRDIVVGGKTHEAHTIIKDVTESHVAKILTFSDTAKVLVVDTGEDRAKVVPDNADQVTTTSFMAPDGPITDLPRNQMAEAYCLAVSAVTEEGHITDEYYDIASRTLKCITREPDEDFETGETVTFEPTPQRFRDAIALLGGASMEELPSLKPEDYQALKDAFPPSIRETIAKEVRRFGVFMNRAVPDSLEIPETTVENRTKDGTESGDNAVNVEVLAAYGGDGTRNNQAMLTGLSIIQKIKQNAVDVLVIPDVSNMSGIHISKIKELCDERRIPFVSGISNGYEENAFGQLDGRKIYILPTDGQKRVEAVSQLSGAQTREDVSASYSTSFAQDRGTNKSYDYSNSPDFASGGGQSGSRNGSITGNVNVSVDTNGRVLRPEEVRAIPDGHLVAINPKGESLGLFNAVTGEWVGPYPKPNNMKKQVAENVLATRALAERVFGVIEKPSPTSKNRRDAFEGEVVNHSPRAIGPQDRNSTRREDQFPMGPRPELQAPRIPPGQARTDAMLRYRRFENQIKLPFGLSRERAIELFAHDPQGFLRQYATQKPKRRG